MAEEDSPNSPIKNMLKPFAVAAMPYSPDERGARGALVAEARTGERDGGWVPGPEKLK